MSAQGVMQTTFCPYCSVQLSYPQGSMFIQCPKCRNTMNPHAPQHTTCQNCGTLLAHPANSICIQCPKCLFAMNARERPSQTNPSSSHSYMQPSSNLPVSKPKKRKDPHAPKASSNAYMIFCKERRAKLKEDHPELPFGKLGAKLGEIWRNMSPEAKKPYEERAALDRERYRRQMQQYSLHSPHMKSDEELMGWHSSSSAKLLPSARSDFPSPAFSGVHARMAESCVTSSSSSSSSALAAASGYSSVDHCHQGEGAPFLPSDQHLLQHTNIPSPVQSSFGVSGGSIMGAAAAATSGYAVSSTISSAPSSSATHPSFPPTASLHLPPSTVQQLQENTDMSSFLDALRILTGNKNLTLSSLLGSHSALSSSSQQTTLTPSTAPQLSTSSVSSSSHTHSLLSSSPIHDNGSSFSSSYLTVASFSSSSTNTTNGSYAQRPSGIVGVTSPTFVTHAPLFSTSALLSPLAPNTAVATSLTLGESSFTEPLSALLSAASSSSSSSSSSCSSKHEASPNILQQHRFETALSSSADSVHDARQPALPSVTIQPPDPVLLAMASQASAVAPSLNTVSTSQHSLFSLQPSLDANPRIGAVPMDLDDSLAAVTSNSSSTSGLGMNGHNLSPNASQAHHPESSFNGNYHTNSALSASLHNTNADSHDISHIHSDTSIGSYGSPSFMDSAAGEAACQRVGAGSLTSPLSPPSSSDVQGHNPMRSLNPLSATMNASATHTVRSPSKPSSSSSTARPASDVRADHNCDPATA